MTKYKVRLQKCKFVKTPFKHKIFENEKLLNQQFRFFKID